MTKEKFEKSLNVSAVGLTQARRNRTRIIKSLGETYHKHAGKISLYEMHCIKLIEEMEVKP